MNKALSNGYFFTNQFLTERRYYDINNELIDLWFTNRWGASFVSSVIKHILTYCNGKYFIEKTPSNVYLFNDIIQEYPNVPVIHVIHDGRDVVSSLMKRGCSLFGGGSRWLFDAVCGISNRGHGNYLEVICHY